MSLRSFVRRSRFAKRDLQNVPADHPFRSVKLEPFPMPFCSYNFATKWLDPFDWRAFTMFVIMFFLLMIVAMLTILAVGIRDVWVWVPMFALLAVSMFVILTANDISAALHEFLDDIRHHLDVDDIREVYKLSPSQLEDKCLKRLIVLAVDLEEIEKRTMPLDRERVDAKYKVEEAFAFFTKHGFMKPVPWQRFFTQPKIQK
jgi:uncharacterized MnhB-related membrane protein